MLEIEKAVAKYSKDFQTVLVKGKFPDRQKPASMSCDYWMLLGSVLCAVFAELLYKGYRKLEG